MSTLNTEPLADHIVLTENELVVHLKDGRILSVPLIWFPSLSNATKKELEDYEILGDGEGIHWNSLDEDLSVMGLLIGNKKQVA